jgi:hypothetical protein
MWKRLSLQLGWHITCIKRPREYFMANRAKILKLLQEIRGFAEITNRRPVCGAAHALWMPSRPSIIKAVTPQRRLDVQSGEVACEPVEIRFGHRLPSSSQLPSL